MLRVPAHAPDAIIFAGCAGMIRVWKQKAEALRRASVRGKLSRFTGFLERPMRPREIGRQ